MRSDNNRSSSRSRSSSRAGSGSGKDRILYDAHGQRVKKSPLSSGPVRFLLFFLLPYLVINAIIFVLVTTSPTVVINVADTDNYVDTKVTFQVKSILPVKELEVTLESEPVEYTKSGSNYTCVVNKNGNLFVSATLINGMAKANYADIAMLDDLPPTMDDSGCVMTDDTVQFTLTDNQSGVDFDGIYAVCEDGTQVTPVKVDKELGLVTLPIVTENMEVFYSDMVGNQSASNITVSNVYVTADGEVIDIAARLAEGEDEAEEEAAE